MDEAANPNLECPTDLDAWFEDYLEKETTKLYGNHAEVTLAEHAVSPFTEGDFHGFLEAMMRRGRRAAGTRSTEYHDDVVHVDDKAIRRLLHRSCNGCSNSTGAEVYRCRQCTDFDYFNKCITSAASTHPGHEFDTITLATLLQHPELLNEEEDKAGDKNVALRKGSCVTCLDVRPDRLERSLREYGIKESDAWKNELPIHLSDLARSNESGCQLCSLLYRGIKTAAPCYEGDWDMTVVIDREFLLTRLECGWLLQFYATSGRPSPWKTLNTAPVYAEDFGSAEVFSKIRAWLENCEQKHGKPECKRAAESALPTRLLRICEEADAISCQLCETGGQSGRFLALSHCWGQETFLTTTTASYDQMKARIALPDLPQSFRDTIFCARQLGIEYVWIDSLCILQDSKLDWEKESAKMSDIYMNAYLVVIASSASKASCGFLGRRPSTVQGIQMEFDMNGESTSVTVQRNMPHSSSPLTISKSKIPGSLTQARAWCMQESILARRIVSFHLGEMVWECHQLCDCECGGITRRRKDSVSILSSFDMSSFVVSMKFSPAHNRSLSGVASIVANRCHDTYLAGVWSKDIKIGLLWRVKKPGPAANIYLSPSFSWVSVGREVTYAAPATRYKSGKPRYGGVAVELLNSGCTVPGANPFGVVTKGFIRLGGLMVTAHIHHDRRKRISVKGFDDRDLLFIADAWLNVVNVGRVDGLEVRTLNRSSQSQLQDGDEADVALLLVADLPEDLENKFSTDGGKHKFGALVLGKVMDSMDVYQRVGILELSSKPEDVGEWLAGLERREVTIIEALYGRRLTYSIRDIFGIYTIVCYTTTHTTNIDLQTSKNSKLTLNPSSKDSPSRPNS